MTSILVLNGPNLNLLGQRQPDVYGTTTLTDIEAMCRAKADALNVTIEFRQSNDEGALLDMIHAFFKGWLTFKVCTIVQPHHGRIDLAVQIHGWSFRHECKHVLTLPIKIEPIMNKVLGMMDLEHGPMSQFPQGCVG